MPTPRTIVLDTFPTTCTSLILPAPGRDLNASETCYQWILDCAAAGNRVVIPAVCYYEALREMERRNAKSKIARLRQFCFSEPNRFLPLTTADLELAAQLWAQARNQGLPTASPAALDVDVILAAQALSLGLPDTDFVVATTNTVPLTRFTPAADWQEVAPAS